MFSIVVKIFKYVFNDIKERIVGLLPSEAKIRANEKYHNMPRGSIYGVRLDDRCQRFFQYIAFDKTNGAEVIRVFKKKYPADYIPDPEQIVTDEVDFYAETWTIPNGVIDGVWSKVGISKNVGDTKNIMFRNYVGVEKTDKMKATGWVVWKISKKRIYFDKLSEEYRERAEWGFIFSINKIMDRIKTGSYHGKIVEVQ